MACFFVSVNRFMGQMPDLPSSIKKNVKQPQRVLELLCVAQLGGERVVIHNLLGGGISYQTISSLYSFPRHASKAPCEQ